VSIGFTRNGDAGHVTTRRNGINGLELEFRPACNPVSKAGRLNPNAA